MRAAGAEVNSAENIEKAEDEEWIKIEWFKLRMRPKSMPTNLRTSNLPPLPPNKTLLEVFGDFMSYLMNCTASFIRDTHPNIPEHAFQQLRNRAEFVIAHPNGWEGAQQARLRKAAVLGGLVPDTPAGKSRVSFVSEGEASLHYCIGEGLVGDVSVFVSDQAEASLIPQRSEKVSSLQTWGEARWTLAPMKYQQRIPYVFRRWLQRSVCISFIL